MIIDNYKHYARRSLLKRAVVVVSILETSKLLVVEGVSYDIAKDYSFEWKLLVTLVVLFFFSLYGMKELFYKGFFL